MKALFPGSLISRSLRSYLPARFTDDQLFLPTTARWLWNEPRKVQQHTLRFDVKALKHVVAKTAGLEGQSERVKVKKLAEGASNKVMTATLGQRRFIVKMPDPLVPRRLITASEVATLEFLRTELDLPVPRVLARSDSDDNAVGREYIILEEARGVDLKTAWPSLDIRQRMDLLEQIVAIQQRLLQASRSFQAYGSLYFTEDAAKFNFGRQIEVSTAKSSRYIIGPLAHEHFMDAVRIEPDFDSGPWLTPHDYLDSLAHSSLLQVRSSVHHGTSIVPSHPFSFPVKPVSDLSNAAVCKMLQIIRMVIPHTVPQSTDYCLPLLWHGDLHDGNIFVSEEGKVTCIIDWQDANIMPLFLTLRKPKFLDMDENAQLFKLPEDLKELPPSVRSETWERFSQTMLNEYYLVLFRNGIPAVAAVYDDDTQTNLIRRQIANYARTSDGHDADALMLRNTLLGIRQNWTSLAQNGRNESTSIPTCPIDISPDELEKHYEDARRFNTFRDILEGSGISATFPLEGWAPVQLFDEWKIGLKQVIMEVMGSLEDDTEREEFQQRLRSWNLTS